MIALFALGWLSQATWAAGTPSRLETLAQDLSGPPVSWTGSILQRLQDGAEMCFVLLRTPDYYGYGPPPPPDATRFVACAAGAFDHDLFGLGREIEVAGNLGAARPRSIGGRHLDLPLVAAAFIRPLPPRSYGPPSPWYPYPPPYYGPYWPAPFPDPYGRWPY